MAIILPQQRKKQSYLSLFFLLLIILIFVVIWQGYRAQIKVKTSSETIPRLPKVEINYAALESPALRDLQLFEEIKPLEGPSGRENPFLPY